MPVYIKDVDVLLINGTKNVIGTILTDESIIDPVEYVEVRCTIQGLVDPRVGIAQLHRNPGTDTLQGDMVILNRWLGDELLSSMCPYMYGITTSHRFIDGVQISTHFTPTHIEVGRLWGGMVNNEGILKNMGRYKWHDIDKMKDIRNGIAG